MTIKVNQVRECPGDRIHIAVNGEGACIYTPLTFFPPTLFLSSHSLSFPFSLFYSLSRYDLFAFTVPFCHSFIEKEKERERDCQSHYGFTSTTAPEQTEYQSIIQNFVSYFHLDCHSFFSLSLSAYSLSSMRERQRQRGKIPGPQSLLHF